MGAAFISDPGSSGGEETEEASYESEPEDLPSLRNRGKAKENENNIIVETAFDAYFTYNKPGRVQTSSNVYSQLVLPLSAEEYSDSLGSISKGLLPIQPALLNGEHCQNIFSRYICELNEGFNILCYGFGSKRRILNQFATTCCSKQGHVVIGNGFQPDFNIKELLNSIENIPVLKDLDWPSTAVEKQGRRIYDTFAQPSQKSHLYIVIHNIDAAPLRTARSKSILALLAHNPRIHIIASIDHLNAPLLWSSSEIFSRKPDQPESNTIPSRGFSWLWHDLTTLVAYDFELAFADRSSLSGAHIGGAHRKTDALAAQLSTAMSETAAFHILASVNIKSKKLFALLGNKQLEAMENGDDGSSNGLQQFGMAYNLLFSLARDNFLATNESAFRSLQVEFKDHGLFLSTPSSGGGGEILWIPLRKERLISVLTSLQ
ncbi:origin recognition complex subunit 2 [Phlegmacium glaucopus]|nr:origin recognition complex subunit 2 [Phlegmacium glaucopus]